MALLGATDLEPAVRKFCDPGAEFAVGLCVIGVAVWPTFRAAGSGVERAAVL
jgi:hypothetical protein